MEDKEKEKIKEQHKKEVNINNIFSSFNLNFELLRGLYSLNYIQPTNIQKLVLSSILTSPNDLIVQSPRLTGKKLSYIIASLQKVSQEKDKKNITQCLIVCDTRESVTKIKNIYKEVSKYMNIRIYSLLGGTIKEDIKEISAGIQIVIGTPGRVLDLINKKILNLLELYFFIIDDFKQMIERGFMETIYNIINISNNRCKKLLFLENNENKDDIDLLLNDELKEKLKLSKDLNIINNNINYKNKLINYKIFNIKCKNLDKINILYNIYKIMDISQSIIYCNEQQTADEVNRNLTEKKYACNPIYEERNKNLYNFKKGKIRIMVTNWDLIVEDINLYNNAIIINYNMPKDIDIYIKTIGRNEFFGKNSIIINFVTADDVSFVNSLEKILDNKIQEFPKEFSVQF